VLAQLDDEPVSLRTITGDDVRAALDGNPDAEVLYTLRVPSPWEARWRVTWIQLHSAGVDHVPLADIPPSVRVTTASGVHAVPMAEHAFGMLLALTRNFARFFEGQARAEWRHEQYAASGIELLRRQTMGILGYGSLGREIARLARAFGMRVLASKRDPGRRADDGFFLPGTGDPEGTIPESLYADRDLDRLLADSDVVVDVLPLTAETEAIVNRRAFASMKAGAIFLNLGRGRTVDEEALIEALRSGHLQAAGLDVTATEPLPSSSPLWHLPNVFITPHMSGDFREYDAFCMMLFRENLHRFRRGEPLLNEVDRLLGY
jgi:phosphoglycerate dehydrogenase-like enzyme